MRGLLNWLKDEYDLPVYITENGFSDPPDIPVLEDEGRVTYYRAYINEVLKGKMVIINVFYDAMLISLSYALYNVTDAVNISRQA